MNRLRLIQIHIAFSAFFLPLLFIMPLSGSADLLDLVGSPEKTKLFEMTPATELPEDKAQLEQMFRDELSQRGLNFQFEYIKMSPTQLVFRPTSKVHLVADRNADGSLSFTEVRPTLLARLLELHKGHGPKLFRWLEVAFSVALVLVALSGFWLAISLKPYRTVFLASFGLGLIGIALALL